jgi:hypothetical protein
VDENGVASKARPATFLGKMVGSRTGGRHAPGDILAIGFHANVSGLMFKPRISSSAGDHGPKLLKNRVILKTCS